MKIHYISHHAILEYDEVQLLLELGHDVFSNGAYLDPAGHFSLPRPGLDRAKFHKGWADIARNHPAKTNLPQELIDPFDLIIVMHQPEVVIQNWDKFRGHNVVWRTIGQSLPHLEQSLKVMRDEGLKIVRYSPKERNLDGYLGEDAMIRFYKDPEIYKNWKGDTFDVVNFSQSLKGRRDFCHYDEIFPVIEKFKGMIYGSGNEDLGQYNGGQVPYDQQIKIMQKSRAMVYGGTWPASYTLSFIEAMMTGLPVVAISKKLAHMPRFQPFDFYEVDEILAKASGIVCDTPEQMMVAIKRLIDDPDHARTISEQQRQVAIDIFGKEKIKSQWEHFLEMFK